MKKFSIHSVVWIIFFLIHTQFATAQIKNNGKISTFNSSINPTANQDALSLRYDSGENATSFGLGGGGTFYWAAYWPSSTMSSYTGLSIYSVDVYIADISGTETLYIWDQGQTGSETGAVLATQAINPPGHSWVNVVLSSPVSITGNDLWIGVGVTGQPPGESPAGGDAGPAVTGYGDMASLDGVSFSSIALGYNWNISANLSDPGCPPPSNLTAYNITTTSATLAWTDNAEASNFDIEFLLHNSLPTGSPNFFGVGNPYILPNDLEMTPNTIYDFYVRANCGGSNNSLWSGPFSFSTACFAIDVFPYFQTFDNNQVGGNSSGCTPDGSVPLWYCWSNNIGDDFDWNINNGATPSPNTGPSDDITSGGKYLYTEASGCDGNTAYINGPEFDFSYVAIPGMSFYYHMNGSDMGTMSMEVSTNQGNSWTELWSKTGTQGTAWNKQTIALNDYAGNPSVMFRWKGITGTGETSDMALDQVRVGESIEGSLQGYVTGVLTGVPMENATVTIGGFSDVTDNTGYYKIEGIPLSTYTYTITCELTDYVTQQIEDYTVTPGMVDLDFELPYATPPNSMEATAGDGLVDLSWSAPLPIVGEIKYDNGVAGAWGSLGTPQSEQHMFYVRFTAPQAGFINQVAVFNKSGASVNWKNIYVCPESGIEPDLANPYEVFTDVPVNSLAGEWELLELTTPMAINSGQDFYVVTQWYEGSTTGPYVGIDIDAPFAERSAFSQDGGATWEIQEFTDWIMRAYYSTSKGEKQMLSSLSQSSSELIDLPELNVAHTKEQQKTAASLKTFSALPLQVPVIFCKNLENTKALSGYHIYKGTDPASLTLLSSTGIATTQYTDNAVSNGNKYYYEVRCVYEEGFSEPSARVSAIPLAVTAGFPFSSDFETDGGGFSAIGDWQWGQPGYANGPDTAASGDNLWATNLTGDYSSNLNSILIQAFDLSAGIDITLTFNRWFDLAGADYCMVAVDQNNDGVFEVLKTFSGSDPNWLQTYVKIPAEFTSGYTKLAFVFQSYDGPTAAGFYLDDLSLQTYSDPKMTLNPLSFDQTIAPDGIKTDHLFVGNTGGFSVDYTAEITQYTDADILFENFDGGIPQGVDEWTIVDGGEPSFSWEGVADYSGQTIDGTPFALVNSQAAGNVEMDEQLISPVFDASGYQSVTLEFDQVFTAAIAFANIEIFDGYDWYWIGGFMESLGAFGAPDHQQIDLTPYIYTNAVQIRFSYYSSSQDYYWAIDNVKVVGFNLPTGWLTLNGQQSMNGSVLPGNTQDIILEFDATGVPEGTWYTNIEVNSNDPLYPSEVIPVSMTVENVPLSPNVDIGIFNTTCGDFEVMLEPNEDLNNSYLTNLQFTVRWPVTSPNANLVDASNSFVTQQGLTVQSNGYNYATFVGINIPVNWDAGTEYKVLDFSHNHEGTGTGEFVIMPADDPFAAIPNVYYAEVFGIDYTGDIYAGTTGIELGKCPASISGTFTANGKVYDGTTDATFETDNLSLEGVIAGDDVQLSNIELDFEDQNVGTEKTVSITSAQLIGDDAVEYELSIAEAPTATADITPRNILVTAEADQTKIYGATDPSPFTFTHAPALETGDNFSGSLSREAGEDVGTYAFTLGSLTAGTNYSLSIAATPVFSITEKDLSIAADDQIKEYDGNVFTGFTVSYNGFITGEDENDLGGTLSFSGDAVTATEVGFYTIIPGGFTSINYNIIYLNGILEITGVSRSLKVFLQGPYNETTDLMNTDLNTNGQLPNTQPYNADPWFYAGTETLPGSLTDEVDWILVELRTGTSETTTIERKAALLHADGSVSVTFSNVVAGTDYYIVLWHRNHMPVMSATAIDLLGLSTPFDFTDILNCYGTTPVVLLEGTTYGMIAGDVNYNGILQYSGPGNDRGKVIAQIVTEGGTTTNSFIDDGYWFADVTMNNQLLYTNTGNDRAVILANLIDINGSPHLNNLYYSEVPGASGSKEKGTNNGPLDITTIETDQQLSVEIITNAFFENSFVDNIQFTLAWKQGDNEIEDMLSSFTSAFMMAPQGKPYLMNGVMHQVFVSVTPVDLPDIFENGDKISVINFAKPQGLAVAERLWIADNDFTEDNNAMYYVSVQGEDATGHILSSALGVDNLQTGDIYIYPNPVAGGKLYLHINSAREENLNVKVFNVNGKQTEQIEYKTIEGMMTHSLDVSQYNAGVYIIHIIGQNTYFTERFIVN